MKPFADYFAEIKRNLEHGDATEHTHRPALKTLLESIGQGIMATNEPTRILCGAPDFNITKGKVPLGHVETKDIGENLNAMEKGKPPHAEQFARYRDGLPNWILTDYIEFRWYVTGALRMTVRFAEVDGKNRLKPVPNGEIQLAALLQSFVTQKAKTVGTAKDLAARMAGMARIIRDLIGKTFEHEVEKGFLHNWLAAFRETLIPDLDEGQFADMFAQTLAYGLFAARVHTPANKDFTREMAAFTLPKTNPFLRKLFSEIAGVDMPETVDWAVDDLVDLLNRADLAAVLKDFGKGKGKEDPVVHFYETFLASYDPKMREIRGVYYTPEPVVSYIVRSVDHLLKTRFNRPQGLADENTLILDPATGTATFLYWVVNQIYEKFAKQKGAWDGYVRDHLLNRVFGFELLIAPYAIAHLKLGMQLAELGYKFGTDQRLGIYLTNTLEEAAKKSEQLFASWITEEANAAAEIKRDRPIMVVLGNPPYSKASYNRSSWIERLMESYKLTVRKEESQIQALSNDYIKFIRFAQWRIDQTGSGVVGLITGHGYVSGPQARDMRASLLKSFDEIYILNLHGSVRREAKGAQGQTDEPVFQIQQGTAIILAVKGSKRKIVRYCDCFGSLESKFQYLNNNDLTTTPWIDLNPVAPNFFFLPPGKEAPEVAVEYEAYPLLSDVFGTGNRSKDKEKRWATGMATQQDEFAVSFDDAEVKKKISDLLSSNSEDDLRSRYELCTTDQWSYQRAKKELASGAWKSKLFDYAHRPFSTMRSVFDRNVISILRATVMSQLISHKNIALVASRVINDADFAHIFVTDKPVDKIFLSSKTSTNAYVFPLYLYDGDEPNKKKRSGGTMLLALFESSPGYSARRANLNPKFIQDLAQRLSLKWVPLDRGDLKKTVGPEDVFHYAYAVFHSPIYRERYAEFLKIDFPRLPLTSNLKLFRRLAAKGAELVAMHLIESPKLNNYKTTFPLKGDDVVEKVQYTDKDNRVWINARQYFGGVPKATWEFRVGGYQVCEKWLKDRKGRKLTYKDIQHYQKMVLALAETFRLMREIDEAISSWPIE